MPKALFWHRLDGAGAEQVLFDDRQGLHAKGTILSATPVPYVCRYELFTDDGWRSTQFEVNVSGAGFARSLKMEHFGGRWRVNASERGNLDATLAAAGGNPVPMPGIDDPGRLDDVADVDLATCMLTNTLPLRRLKMVTASPGTFHTVNVAWILTPSLVVMPSEQSYTACGKKLMRFASGTFTADLTVDSHGYLVRYPGVAQREGGRTP